MSKSGRKTQEMKQVSFRMPAGVHEDYIAVAESRGVDLSALLNWVTAEFRPVLLLRRAENEVGMLRAVALGLSLHPHAGLDQQQAMKRLNELIGQLQEVASKLLVQVSGSGMQSAA